MACPSSLLRLQTQVDGFRGGRHLQLWVVVAEEVQGLLLRGEHEHLHGRLRGQGAVSSQHTLADVEADGLEQGGQEEGVVLHGGSSGRLHDLEERRERREEGKE